MLSIEWQPHCRMCQDELELSVPLVVSMLHSELLKPKLCLIYLCALNPYLIQGLSVVWLIKMNRVPALPKSPSVSCWWHSSVSFFYLVSIKKKKIPNCSSVVYLIIKVTGKQNTSRKLVSVYTENVSLPLIRVLNISSFISDSWRVGPHFFDPHSTKVSAWHMAHPQEILVAWIWWCPWSKPQRNWLSAK